MKLSKTSGTLLLAALSWCCLAGCKHADEPRSELSMADPGNTSQLLGGFYQVEDKSWRWVARNFSVALKPPRGAGKEGGRLTVRFFISDDELEKTGPLTLTAKIDGKRVGEETFSSPGSHDFTLKLSAGTLDTNILPVQFSFDKAMLPPADHRELAAVVVWIGLVAGQGK